MGDLLDLLSGVKVKLAAAAVKAEEVSGKVRGSGTDGLDRSAG